MPLWKGLAPSGVSPSLKFLYAHRLIYPGKRLAMVMLEDLRETVLYFEKWDINTLSCRASG